jgi:hypothetical protein
MSTTETRLERDPNEVFNQIKTAILTLPGFKEVSFTFKGKVIKASARSSEEYDFAERTTYDDKSHEKTGTNTASAQYFRTHVQFQQGELVVEVAYSPRTSILKDTEARGGRGGYQTREENFLIKDVNGELTVHEKGAALDSNMELIADLCEALTSYNPNEGGLADLRSGYKDRVEQVTEAVVS